MAAPTAARRPSIGDSYRRRDLSRVALGLGIVHTQDMEAASRAVESGAWQPMPTRFEELPERFRYRLSPAAR